ncbi:Conidiation protein 6-domain-containing protein [Russula compacta]|nr:Conidiation protein 6-domain-containing protein [Russula compacta]
MSDINRVAGGHKAAIHNPNVSAQAKEHSRQVVEEIQDSGAVREGGSVEQSSPLDADGKNDNRVLGGYKATLKNPNVTDEAKERARQVLQESDSL